MMRNKFAAKVNDLRVEKAATESKYWHLLELERSYQFYIGNLPVPEIELYFEHDELLGENVAFENNFALSMIDVLEKLEEECPETAGIIAEKGRIELIRKKNLSNPGILIKIDKQVRDFFSDKAMATFNFLDFYDDLKEGLNQSTLKQDEQWKGDL